MKVASQEWKMKLKMWNCVRGVMRSLVDLALLILYKYGANDLGCESSAI